jgi:hypothetical protein
MLVENFAQLVLMGKPPMIFQVHQLYSFIDETPTTFSSNHKLTTIFRTINSKSWSITFEIFQGIINF